jgi:DNA repair exonuclease SbcCD nuclease subunit
VSSDSSFSFLHCGDLHLDSPFEGIHTIEPRVAEVLRDATFGAFDKVIEHAIKKQADFLIVAGDIYDGADRSLRAQLRFRDSLQRAIDNEIRCFVAHGNHDPLSGWEARIKMPDGVHRFEGDGVERVPVRLHGQEVAQVYGISFGVREVRENLAKQFRRESGSPFAIGVLHCNVGGNTEHDNYAPCTLEDLVEASMDYWALGHIHARRVLSQGKPWVVYPGNTQGRNPRESGEKGCYLVKVGGTGEVELEFLATDVVRWVAEEVSIVGLRSLDDLLDKLLQIREEIRNGAQGQASILRLRLTGRGEIHSELKRVDPDQDIAAHLREGEPDRRDFVWIESVQLRTQPAIDMAKRRLVSDFVGDFLRAAEELRALEYPGRAITSLLSREPEHRVIATHLDQLGDSELLELLAEAETYGLDQLLGGE